MRALVFEGPGRIVAVETADPEVYAAGDAVVAVERAGLCGSDLHPYEGREPARPGVVPGHEAVGTVVRTGSEVTRFRLGDRVIVPFTTSCGRCGPCRRGLTARCDRGRLFGWGAPDGAPPLHGGQAELLLAPLADTTLVPWPDGLSPDGAVLLSDNLPTGIEALRRADPVPGTEVAVVGCGAVGLSVVAVAVGAGFEVTAVDPVDARRRLARGLGAAALDPAGARERAGTLPAVVEAAGSDPAQRLAFDLVEPGGRLSVIAVQTSPAFPFGPVEAYDRNVTVVFGRASVRATLEGELGDRGRCEALVRLADRLAGVVVSDPGLPLDDGPGAYRRFADRTGSMVKATFAPAGGAGRGV